LPDAQPSTGSNRPMHKAEIVVLRACNSIGFVVFDA
jgi:hypothetical protein